MNKIQLVILGSRLFSNIINELEFSDILNSSDQFKNIQKKILIKIVFPENLKVKEVKNLLSQNEPIILFLNQKEYIRENNLILFDFHISLELPIEILSFKRINDLTLPLWPFNIFKRLPVLMFQIRIEWSEEPLAIL